MMKRNRHPLVSSTLILISSSLILFGSFCREQPQAESHDGLTRVPEWATDAVWYQIFPERFRNGDSLNDPVPRELEGSWPHDLADGWQVSRWTGDWYEMQPWERTSGRDFYYNVQQRRYGGDLQGVIDRLDYLKGLGITAIYFNPLFESPSLHKYDAAMYHHIDNNFGPDPEGDRASWDKEDPSDPETWTWTSADRLFLRLLEEAHRMGIRIIIDGVFNHTGQMFWAFRDVVERQEDSPYRDWYMVRRFDNPDTPENEFDYVGWNGVRELPELREDSDGLVSGPREHVHAVVRRWMDPNGDGDPSDGIDGWRLDVAEKVNIEFWKDFRRWVREINPEAYLVGEVWWEDWQHGIMFDASPWLQGDAFDAVMNYRWARVAFSYFAPNRNKILASTFAQRITSLLEDYPEPNNFVLMNLFDSHDTDRMASHILNADLPYDKDVTAAGNRTYNVQKPGSEARAVQRLMTLFQMTAVGAPTIYYGTEAGMWGADDPDCRKPMLWPEFSYDAERHHPYGAKRSPDRNTADTDLTGFYRQMIQLRKSNSALRRGDFSVICTDDIRDHVAFIRSDGHQLLLVVLNNSTDTATVAIPLTPPIKDMRWKDLLSGSGVVVKDAVLEVGVAGRWGAVLEGRPR